MLKYVLSLACLALSGFIVYTAVTLPVVQISHATNSCVNVIPFGSCDTLPDRYFTEYVK